MDLGKREKTVDSLFYVNWLPSYLKCWPDIISLVYGTILTKLGGEYALKCIQYVYWKGVAYFILTS